MSPQLHTMKLFPKSRDTAGTQLRKIHLARGVCQQWQQCQGARLNGPGDFTKSPVHGPPIWTQFDFSNVSVITHNHWLVLPRHHVDVTANLKVMPLSSGQRLSMVLPVYVL